MTDTSGAFQQQAAQLLNGHVHNPHQRVAGTSARRSSMRLAQPTQPRRGLESPSSRTHLRQPLSIYPPEPSPYEHRESPIQGYGKPLSIRSRRITLQPVDIMPASAPFSPSRNHPSLESHSTTFEATTELTRERVSFRLHPAINPNWVNHQCGIA